MRKEASHKAEIVSQLLLGETAALLEETKDFLRVKCLYDGYEGWCQKSQLAALMIDLPATNIFINNAVGEVLVNDKPCRVSIATPWFDKDISAKHFTIQYPTQTVADATAMIFNEANIKTITAQFLNTPYLWGGKSVLGIDCSGFTQQVFKMFGIFYEEMLTNRQSKAILLVFYRKLHAEISLF